MVLIVALGLSACASRPLPSEAAGIILISVSSGAGDVQRPTMRMNDGYLELEGDVSRQRDAETTADTHIDIVFLDVVGRVLAIDMTRFNPRSLPRTLRLPQPHGHYRILIPQLPPETRVIEVRAHDGAHETRPGN